MTKSETRTCPVCNVQIDNGGCVKFKLKDVTEAELYNKVCVYVKNMRPHNYSGCINKDPANTVLDPELGYADFDDNPHYRGRPQ